MAWTVLAGNPKHAWRGEWLRLLPQLRPAVPPTMTVMVLTDRGLYVRWLYQRIVRLGWHPFLRIKAGGTFRPQASDRFQPLRTFARQPGSRWQGRGTAFVSHPSRWDCTLLACWEEGHKEAWFILTDLSEAIAATRETLARTHAIMERTRKLLQETEEFLQHLCARQEREAEQPPRRVLSNFHLPPSLPLSPRPKPRPE